ncbi:hypothetical protein [Lysinibacillus sphaericus]|uniref:hypothetical protein n=1 Tax=Lysinibacillus sphaericus TaxID=1421 RepID=UPI000C185B52|nr:hypothetical protein [Lysinibacillus sphaericus]PIJ96753.1 hypothetical protein CTN02_16935 [Lysinibacillus sphaericus]
MEMFVTIVVTVLLTLLVYLLIKNILRDYIESSKFSYVLFGINSLNVLNLMSLILAILSVVLTISTDFSTFLTENIKTYNIVYLVGFLIIVVLLFHRMNIKNDKILSLEEKLNSETKDLWKNYAELNQFYRDKTLIDGMQRFVNSTTHVLSAQRYKYKLYKTNGHLIILINGDYSFIKEGEDLNTVSQAYFKFSLKDVKKLITAITKIKNSEKTGNLGDNDYTDLIKLYISWGKELQEKKSSDYNDSDSLKYQLLIIVQNLIENVMDNEDSFDLKFDQNQICLLDGRKSGIDIAIFLLKKYIDVKYDLEIFNYKGTSDSKKFRMYSNVEVLNSMGEQFAFVLAHYADLTWSEEMQKKKVLEDTQNFINFVQSEMHFIK